MNIDKLERSPEGYYSTPLGNLPSVNKILDLIRKIPGEWYAKETAALFRREILDPLCRRGRGRLTLKALRALDLEEVLKRAKEAAPVLRDEAADLGTRVHDAIDRFFRGEEPEIEPDMEQAWAAFLAWAREHRVIRGYGEVTVYHSLGYAGTLDFMGTVDGEPTILDFKSSKGFWPEMVMQIAAYSAAWEEMTGQRVDQVAILRLDKETGMPHYKPYSLEEAKHALTKFVCVVAYFKACEAEREWKRDVKRRVREEKARAKEAAKAERKAERERVRAEKKAARTPRGKAREGQREARGEANGVEAGGQQAGGGDEGPQGAK